MTIKRLSREEAVGKLRKYCAYQERCHKEVRKKLLDIGIYGSLLEEIISELIKENYLNEERFAMEFAHGKFNIKNWGKVKIEVELKKRDISPYCINKALNGIDPEAYIHKLKNIIEQKLEEYDFLKPMEQKHKCYQYCVRKGYEVDHVLKYLPE